MQWLLHGHHDEYLVMREFADLLDGVPDDRHEEVLAEADPDLLARVGDVYERFLEDSRSPRFKELLATRPNRADVPPLRMSDERPPTAAGDER
jgi:hypothetical protein